MREVTNITSLNQDEQKALTMLVVQACLEFGKENNKSFEDVMQEDLFPEKASQAFSDAICYNIKLLKEEGLLSGDVNLEYDNLEVGEDASKGINSAFSTFDDISITEKGSVYIKYGYGGIKAVELKEKAMPFLKQIGNIALQTVVKTLVTAVLDTVGIPV